MITLTPVKVVIDETKIQLKIGDDTVVYETDVNAFEANAGVVVRNVELSLIRNSVYFLSLEEISKEISVNQTGLSEIDTKKTIACGNIFDHMILSMNQEYENILLVIDFSNIDEVNESFLESYIRFLLSTENKVLSINMNISISKQFSLFVEKYMKPVETE